MKTLSDPTADVTCSRCGKPNAVWDIGTCWDCLDLDLNDMRAKQLQDCTLIKRMDAVKAFIEQIRLPLTTDVRRQLDSFLQEVAKP